MDRNADEYSESGAPIWRHGERESEWTPPDMEDCCTEQITEHVEEHIGPVSNVWHELISDIVHIDVLQIEPTPDRPYWTLVTSGMSDLAMAAPEEMADWAYAELMICLPADWPMTQDAFEDEANYWPIRMLKFLARFPHEYETWLSWGHTIPNGDPPAPFADNVDFSCVMLSRPRTVSTDFWVLPIREDKVIQFFSIMPLYVGETDLKLKKGAEELEERFEKNKITEIVDIHRPDVSARPWWRLW